MLGRGSKKEISIWKRPTQKEKFKKIHNRADKLIKEFIEGAS
jgi:hypothetical protein